MGYAINGINDILCLFLFVSFFLFRYENFVSRDSAYCAVVWCGLQINDIRGTIANAALFLLFLFCFLFSFRNKNFVSFRTLE